MDEWLLKTCVNEVIWDPGLSLKSSPEVNFPQKRKMKPGKMETEKGHQRSKIQILSWNVRKGMRDRSLKSRHKGI